MRFSLGEAMANYIVKTPFTISSKIDKIRLTVRHDESSQHEVSVEVRDLLTVIDKRDTELKEMLSKGSPLQKYFLRKTIEYELFKTKQIKTHIWKYTARKWNLIQPQEGEIVPDHTKAEMQIISAFLNLLDPQIAIPGYKDALESPVCSVCQALDVPLSKRSPPFRMNTEDDFKKILQEIEADTYASFGIASKPDQTQGTSTEFEN